MISPSLLEENGITVYKTVQRAGDIMITFPYGYHQGFNYGFNCAESANFANDSWVDIGKKAKFCKCVDDSVRIDVEELMNSQTKFDAAKWCSLVKEMILNYQWGSTGGIMVKRMVPKKGKRELDSSREKVS
jgi:hypothetical protein